ncbi:MAG: hypothetical protein U0235_07790 [Polyangiaceae bacterium]
MSTKHTTETMTEIDATALEGVTGGAWYDGTFIGDAVTAALDVVFAVRDGLGGYGNDSRSQVSPTNSDP